MRILIADDNLLVRQGVRKLLSAEPTWQVCGEAKNGAETLELARALVPDLLLLDMSMPGGMGGLEVTRAIRQTGQHLKIVIMSQHDPVHLLPRALEAGADGCVEKARMACDLVTFIKLKVAGSI